MTWARRALALVDVAAEHGLRDGALLALVDAGLDVPALVALKARDVRYVTRRSGDSLLGIYRRAVRQVWVVCLLDHEQGARLLAYLEDSGTWGRPAPLFAGDSGKPLTAQRLHQVLAGWRRRLLAQPPTPAPAAARRRAAK